MVEIVVLVISKAKPNQSFSKGRFEMPAYVC